MTADARKAGEARVLACLPGAARHEVSEAIGGPVQWCESVGQFLAATRTHVWVAAILDWDQDSVEIELVRRVAEGGSVGALFLTSATTSVDRVLAAERAGAVALLPHPPTREILEREVRPVLTEPGGVPVPPAEPGAPETVVGSSPALMEVFGVVARVAPTPATVLITGESGTGKELVARALHDQSRRSDAPFVAVNCAAIPDTLLEAELFGYEPGAFTGAVGRSDGRFGRADGGTLFLDEIGELSQPLQAKLLRVLESGEVERLGGRESVHVDARIVAATNQRLRERVRSGRFREDLLFRLAVVEVRLPPLRDRPGDLLPLTVHFASRLAARYGAEIRALSQAACDKLSDHAWPGNVRELRNVMDRAVILARGGVIRSGDLHLGDESPRTSPLEARDGRGYLPTMSLEKVEGLHIRNVLRHTGGHMGEAAEILGVHRNTMTAKVREYGIDVDAISQEG